MTKTKTALQRELDGLWAKIVKLRAQYRCQHCGSVHELAAHHLIRTWNKHYRWEVKNGICLCARCHSDAHDHPASFKAWLHIGFPGVYLWLTTERPGMKRGVITQARMMEAKAELERALSIPLPQNGPPSPAGSVRPIWSVRHGQAVLAPALHAQHSSQSLH